MIRSTERAEVVAVASTAALESSAASSVASVSSAAVATLDTSRRTLNVVALVAPLLAAIYLATHIHIRTLTRHVKRTEQA